MRSGASRVLAAIAAIVAGPLCLAQVNTTEVEPNETKASATAVTGMLPGDTLTGTCTGTATTPGATSLDTWNITTAAAPAPGVYEYRLAINESTTTGHTMSIRGWNQTGGVIGSTDTACQTAAPTTAHFVKWYANEQPSQIYLRVTGTTATTAPYIITLSRFAVTVNSIPNAIEAGPLYITTIGQTTVDTDLWLYDANLNAILDAGNDNETIAGGGAGTTTQSRLQRNLPAGNYILAITTAGLANNLASPADDRNRAGAVTDFSNAICTSSANGAAQDNDFVIGNRCTGSSQSISNSQPFMQVNFYSLTLTGSQLGDPILFSAANASPSNVGQGSATLLTVTASGGTPTAVTGDLSAFGLSSAEAFHDDGANGDAVPGDGIWSYGLSVPAAQATGAYTINVSGTAADTCSPPTRSITLNITPPNNACANAVPVVVGGSYSGTTLGAVGAGGLAAGCNTITGTNPGVWYVFTETSPTPRRLIASLCDPVTDFDAQMVLYTGSCGAFTCVWGNDGPACGCPNQNPARNNGGTSHSDIPAILNWTPNAPGNKCTVPGQTYYIGVLNRVAGTGGNFVLHLEDTGETCEGVPPAHDACSAARPLTHFPTWDLVFRDFATADPDVSCNNPANTSSLAGIWYTYTPTQPGDLFHAKIPDQGAAGSSLDTVVTVFSAAPDCSSLTEVACVDAVEGYVNMFSTPIASLSAGRTYYIEVSNQGTSAAVQNAEYMGFNFVGTGPSPCCRSDYDGDGDVGTDADIEAFFACLAGSCCANCPPDADFNCDGDIGTDQDIESFFRVLAGGQC
jgi:hypothetical protein